MSFFGWPKLAQNFASRDSRTSNSKELTAKDAKNAKEMQRKLKPRMNADKHQ
jgi:hypothetical protein